MGDGGEADGGAGGAGFEECGISDDADGGAGAGGAGIEDFAGEQGDVVGGEDEGDVLEFGALRFVDGHGEGVFDVGLQGGEVVGDELAIAQEDGGEFVGGLGFGQVGMGAFDPDDDALVAVEEAAFVVVVEHHDGFAGDVIPVGVEVASGEETLVECGVEACGTGGVYAGQGEDAGGVEVVKETGQAFGGGGVEAGAVVEVGGADQVVEVGQVCDAGGEPVVGEGAERDGLGFGGWILRSVVGWCAGREEFDGVVFELACGEAVGDQGLLVGRIEEFEQGRVAGRVVEGAGKGVDFAAGRPAGVHAVAGGEADGGSGEWFGGVGGGQVCIWGEEGVPGRVGGMGLGQQIAQDGAGIDGGELFAVAEEDQVCVGRQCGDESFHHEDVDHGGFVDDDDAGVERVVFVVVKGLCGGGVTEQAVQGHGGLEIVEQEGIRGVCCLAVVLRFVDVRELRQDGFAHAVGGFSGGGGQGDGFGGESKAREDAEDGDDDGGFAGAGAAGDDRERGVQGGEDAVLLFGVEGHFPGVVGGGAGVGSVGEDVVEGGADLCGIVFAEGALDVSGEYVDQAGFGVEHALVVEALVFKDQGFVVAGLADQEWGAVVGEKIVDVGQDLLRCPVGVFGVQGLWDESGQGVEQDRGFSGIEWQVGAALALLKEGNEDQAEEGAAFGVAQIGLEIDQFAGQVGDGGIEVVVFGGVEQVRGVLLGAAGARGGFAGGEEAACDAGGLEKHSIFHCVQSQEIQRQTGSGQFVERGIGGAYVARSVVAQKCGNGMSGVFLGIKRQYLRKFVDQFPLTESDYGDAAS